MIDEERVLLRDRFGRSIDYLRVSVTDRCDLRCIYCMPEAGVPLLPPERILRFEEIVAVVEAARRLGIHKVRLTGGEPLVRRGIVDLVRMLTAIEGIDDWSLTTNGQRLAPLAEPLAKAGLHRVNVSLDAIDPARYAELSRGGRIEPVLAGIGAARRAGLWPIKLNCVVKESSNEPDAQQVARFGADAGLEVRFIPQMHLPSGRFSTVQGGRGGHCASCGRLRLSSDGMIRPCLFSDLAFPVRELGPREALLRAIEAKPESGSACHQPIHVIGG